MHAIKDITKSTARRRPKEAQRKAILDAAAEAFFKSGFEGTSVDAIIERIGGSKRAVYAHFGSKRGLFVAIVMEHVERALASFESEELRGHDLRSRLQDFGCRMLELLTSPKTSALFSMIIGEGRRFPELAKDFFENGPERATDLLTKELQAHLDRGEIALADCRSAAEYFIGMLRSNQIGVLLGARKAPNRQEAEDIVRDVVNIFLDGILHVSKGVVTQGGPNQIVG
jgi:AcrR family transcriptional regulator